MNGPQTGEIEVPAVMIVGAGLGGLMLGALLEQIDVPYHIFERATVVRPLGGVMTLGAGILPVFEQLGLLEQIKEISKVYRSADLFHADMTELVSFDRLYLKEAVGHHSILFARPKLYDLLRARVPDNKISMGKKVLRTEEQKDRISIYCSDGTQYDGDILVGADGAYSGVRQSLYKKLDERGLLPKADTENFSIAYILMVGVAEPKDLDKYPELKEETSRFITVIGGNYKTWGAICTPGNQICWTLTIQVPQMQAEDQQFRNSEWSAESNENMIKEFEDLPCPLGGTMKEVIEATPKEMISKVFLEEKVFKTWHYGRTVLLGDACHKLNPAGGLGANNAFQDAVVLANCIHEMRSIAPESITHAFESYYKQRIGVVKTHYDRSAGMAKSVFGQTLKERILRHILFNYIPVSLLQRATAKTLEYCPKIAWLPPPQNRGSSGTSSLD